MRIAELASLHPRVRLSQMKLSIVSLAVAAQEVEGAALPPSVLSDYLLDIIGDEDREDEDDEEQLELYMDMIRRELKFSWHHPSAGLFLTRMLQMTGEQEDRDLRILGLYFADLLTAFGGPEPRHPRHQAAGGALPLPPSVIAQASLAAARLTLTPNSGHKVCIRKKIFFKINYFYIYKISRRSTTLWLELETELLSFTWL